MPCGCDPAAFFFAARAIIGKARQGRYHLPTFISYYKITRFERTNAGTAPMPSVRKGP